MFSSNFSSRRRYHQGDSKSSEQTGKKFIFMSLFVIQGLSTPVFSCKEMTLLLRHLHFSFPNCHKILHPVEIHPVDRLRPGHSYVFAFFNLNLGPRTSQIWTLNSIIFPETQNPIAFYLTIQLTPTISIVLDSSCLQNKNRNSKAFMTKTSTIKLSHLVEMHVLQQLGKWQIFERSCTFYSTNHFLVSLAKNNSNTTRKISKFYIFNPEFLHFKILKMEFKACHIHIVLIRFHDSHKISF